MNSKPLTIVIYPPSDISERAIVVSKKLKNEHSLFVLDGKKYWPHITLYMTEFPLKNVAEIKKLLKQFSIKTKPFNIHALGYRQNNDGYVDVEYKKSKVLSELQTKIITLLNPLREGLMREKDKARISNISKSEQKDLENYGYRSIGVKYVPHLTLTRFSKIDQLVLPNNNETDFSFQVRKIGLFYVGDHGSCRELIESYDLYQEKEERVEEELQSSL